MENIYESIFREVYGYELDELGEEKAKAIRKSIVELRKSYRADRPETDYENPDIRKAYMLAYYPNYMLPINELMKKFVISEIENNENKRIRISFFAAGPGPEVYGCLKALNDSGLIFPKRLVIYILDFEKQWEVERNVTVKYLRKLNNLKISPLNYIAGCDLKLDCSSKCVNWINCQNSVFSSDIFIMENCINHMSEDVCFAQKLKKKISYMKKDALFIIIDLDYKNVKNVLREIVDFNKEYVNVLASNIDTLGNKSILDIQIPEKIRQYIFTGEKDLIPKKNTKYFYAILKRKQA